MIWMIKIKILFTLIKFIIFKLLKLKSQQN